MRNLKAFGRHATRKVKFMEIGGLGNNERAAQCVLIAKVVDVAAHACLVRD
jgi:hypothetical protein